MLVIHAEDVVVAMVPADGRVNVLDSPCLQDRRQFEYAAANKKLLTGGGAGSSWLQVTDKL